MKFYFTQIDPPSIGAVDALAKKGWDACHLPFREVTYLDPKPVWRDYDALVISSKHAARWLRDHRPGHLPPVAAVGESTNALLQDCERIFTVHPPKDAASLVTALHERFPEPARFLFLRGGMARDTMARGLADHHLEALTVYQTRRLPKKPPPLSRGMVYFQAPSTVTDYVELYNTRPEWIGVIGPSTARAAEARSWKIDFRPSRPENRYLVRELPDASAFNTSKGIQK